MNMNQHMLPRKGARGAKNETAGEATGHLQWDSLDSRLSLIGLSQYTPVLRPCKGVRAARPIKRMNRDVSTHRRQGGKGAEWGLMFERTHVRCYGGNGEEVI